jgi:hypothetical protein
MKKNFFKKLSFVLALAMIVTALAPATGVFAAAKPKLNASKVYIHVAEKTQEFDFNIANKKTGWKYTWKSSNKDVAEVASNGLVTAVGKGTATISVVIKDKKGKKVDTLKGTVVVRDNIKKLTIKNAPADGKLAVGATYDFNRSYVTASGNTKKTSGITRWEVDKTGATIVADSGLFTATEAGEYTITARAFQSKAKYNSWVKDATKYASYVTATASYTVKVAPSMTKVEQTDLDSFKVTFDSPVKDVKTKLSVVQIINGTEVYAGVKDVTMSEGDKVATVDMNNDFAQENVYKVKYPELGELQFTAAKVDEKLVTSIKIKTATVQETRSTAIDVALYNKDMVNIANDTLLSRITLESSASGTVVNGRELAMYTKGNTTTVTATYHTYDYGTDGKEIGLLTDSATVTCVAYADYTLSAIKAFTVKKAADGDPDWLTVNHNVAMDDTGYKLYAKLTGKKYDGSDVEYVTSNTDISGNIKFTASNTNVLTIGENSGILYPVQTGSSDVIIKYNDVVVGSVNVVVQAKRTVAAVTLDKRSATASNKFSEDTKFELTVKDQFGDKLRYGTDYTVEFSRNTTPSGSNETSDVTVSTASIWDKTDNYYVNIDAFNADPGTYTYSFKVKDEETKAVQTHNFSLDVKTSNQPVIKYTIVTNKSQYDTNLDKKSGNIDEDVTFSIYGVASDGTKITKLDLSSAPIVSLEVKKGSDPAFTLGTGNDTYTIDGNQGKLRLVDTQAKSAGALGAVTKQGIGTYVINAEISLSGDTKKYSTSFSVIDTEVPAKAVVEKTMAVLDDPTDVMAAIKECFAISLNDLKAEDDKYLINLVQGVDFDKPNDNQFVIRKIYVKEFLNDAETVWFVHEIKMNQTIYTKQK